MFFQRGQERGAHGSARGPGGRQKHTDTGQKQAVEPVLSLPLRAGERGVSRAVWTRARHGVSWA